MLSSPLFAEAAVTSSVYFHTFLSDSIFTPLRNTLKGPQKGWETISTFSNGYKWFYSNP